MKAGLKAAYELCEAGGDWERKNRLKVLSEWPRLSCSAVLGPACSLMSTTLRRVCR